MKHQIPSPGEFVLLRPDSGLLDDVLGRVVRFKGKAEAGFPIRPFCLNDQSRIKISEGQVMASGSYRDTVPLASCLPASSCLVSLLTSNLYGKQTVGPISSPVFSITSEQLHLVLVRDYTR